MSHPHAPVDDVERLANALENHQAHEVRHLLAKDPGLARRPGPDGLYPMCKTFSSNDQACFDLLLPHIDPRQGNPAGQTFLMMATYFNRPAMVEALLPLSDPQQRSHDGETALMLAAGHGRHKCMIPWLNDEEARKVNHKGRSALMIAAVYDFPVCVVNLLPWSDVNQVEPATGLNAMGLAAVRSNLRCLEPLLQVQDPRPLLATLDLTGKPAAKTMMDAHALVWLKRERTELNQALGSPPGTIDARPRRRM